MDIDFGPNISFVIVIAIICATVAVCTYLRNRKGD